MPVSAMVRLAQMLDADWRCPLGDEAARRFGRTQAVFVRSSASHVFVTDGGASSERLVLRMRAADEEHVLHQSVTTAAALVGAGAPVAAPARSANGRLIERVDGLAVAAMQAVEGTTLDSDEIDESSAHRWGALLAELHESARALTPDTDESHGLVHGDPEPDNVVWAADGPVFVDLDDVRRDWYAADIAFALRDWSPPGGPPDLSEPVAAAFLDGYRSRRAFTDVEVSRLPRLAREQAAATLHRLGPVLEEAPGPDWPDWARQLHERVGDTADTLRAALR